MAKFSKEVQLKYGKETYEEMIKTYDWIETSANKWAGGKAVVSINLIFSLGEITCSVKDIEEFREIAYGASGYKLSSFNGTVSNGKNRIMFSYLIDFSVSAYNKLDLESFLNILENTSLEETENLHMTYIESQINIENQNNGTIVQGDNNTVASNDGQININTSKKESKLKKWLAAVGQNILSNWIWYLLTILATALITYFSAK